MTCPVPSSRLSRRGHCSPPATMRWPTRPGSRRSTAAMRRRPPTARRVRLPDGARISIRPIRAADAEAFVRAYARLSHRSRERLYLSLSPELGPADVRYLTSVDRNEHGPLVALDRSREILGSASASWRGPAPHPRKSTVSSSTPSGLERWRPRTTYEKRPARAAPRARGRALNQQPDQGPGYADPRVTRRARAGRAWRHR
jgi:hypothetical protein